MLLTVTQPRRSSQLSRSRAREIRTCPSTGLSTLVVRGLFTAAILVSNLPALAATFRSGDEVIIQAHEVIEDDLVVWASYVRVDGIVKGDLVAFASEIEVAGVVEQELIAVGKTLYLNGRVHDDARIAAYAIALGEQARVGDDLFALAYSLETKPESAVGGTLHAAGYQLLLAGQVAEDVLARVGALELRGLIAGDVHAIVGGVGNVTNASLVIDPQLEIPEVDPGIWLASGTAIGGDLVYQAIPDARIDPGAVVTGRIEKRAWETQTPGAIPFPATADTEPDESETRENLQRLGMLLVLGLVLVLVFPRWSSELGTEVQDRPGLAFGWGLGAVIFVGAASFGIGLVAIILLASFVGAGFGGLAVTVVVLGSLAQAALIAPFLISLIYVAPLLACLGLGRFALERLGSDTLVERGAVAICTGALLYAMLRAIPFLGVLVGAVGALIGLGAIALRIREIQSSD